MIMKRQIILQLQLWDIVIGKIMEKLVMEQEVFQKLFSIILVLALHLYLKELVLWFRMVKIHMTLE